MSNTSKNLKKRLKAPQNLVEATKKGECVTSHKHADTTTIHIRRFSKMLAAYACVAALIVGTIYLLPTLLGEDKPPVTQPPSVLTTAPDQPDQPDPTDNIDPTEMLELLNHISPDRIDASVRTYYENSRIITDSAEIETILTELKALVGSAPNMSDSKKEVEHDRRSYTITLNDSTQALEYSFEFAESGHLRCSDGNGFGEWYRVDVTMASYLFPTLDVDIDHSDQIFESLYGGVVLLYELNPYDIRISTSDNEDEWSFQKSEHGSAFHSILTALETLMKSEGQAADQDYVNSLDATKITLSLNGNPRPNYPGESVDTWILEYSYELVDGKYLRYSAWQEHHGTSEWYEVDSDSAALIDLLMNKPGDKPVTPTREKPMTGEEVEKWMDTHTMLNDLIDQHSLHANAIGFHGNGGMANLFDDIFTQEEWEKAEQEGRFEAATYTDKVDTNGDGVIGYNEENGLTDCWIELGVMQFSGSLVQGALYWSMNEKVTLDSYVIYTGIESDIKPGRYPVYWKLYATNDDALAKIPNDLSPSLTSPSVPSNKDELEEAGWILLDDVYEGSIENGDATPYGYTIDEENQGAYKHYCWLVGGYEYAGVLSVNGLKLYAAD